MRIVNEKEIENNVNNFYKIEQEMLDILRIGGCRYI